MASGAASVVRNGQAGRRRSGTEVFESDIVRTGADGRLAVMLRTRPASSLGPEQRGGPHRASPMRRRSRTSASGLRLARGVLSYVSGLVAKLAPEAVRIQTPTAIIGVRGTHVLVRVEAP